MRLHWLPIKSRIEYKLCLQMHLIHTSQRPDYMAEIVELTAANSSQPVLSFFTYEMSAGLLCRWTLSPHDDDYDDHDDE
jgi:hypothetical protein